MRRLQRSAWRRSDHQPARSLREEYPHSVSLCIVRRKFRQDRPECRYDMNRVLQAEAAGRIPLPRVTHPALADLG
jgi:hypothetical protein